MPRVSVDLNVLRESLGDASLREVRDAVLRVRLTSPSLTLPRAKLRLGANAALDIAVFNDEKDRDEDSVLARPTAAAPPLIAYETQQAWLKYKLTAKVDARTAERAGLFSASAGASHEVELSDYRVHRAADGAWQSVATDLNAPRSILDLADVRRLEPSEALAIELGGELATSVTFDVADALSTTMSDLASEFPAGLPIAVRTRGSLSVTAAVKLSDDFTVVVSRQTGGAFRFSIRKARAHRHTFGVDVTLGGSVSGAPWVDAALDAVFEAVTGFPRSGLSSIDDHRAGDIAARLGLRSTAADAVRRALVRLANRLRTRLHQAVTWKAAAGFAYEYSRIEEHSALADFILLDESLLEHDHALALSGDLETLLPLLRADRQSRRVVRYLHEATIAQRATGGFSLGLGRWALKTRDERVFRQTTRTSIDGFKFITSYGAHKYDESNVPGNDIEWAVELKADSTEFLERPATDSFDYGLHYQVELERKSLSKSTLRRMVDFAAMWDVASWSEPEALNDAIGKAATIRIQLLWKRTELEATLAVMTADFAAWAEALAGAMPYHDVYGERNDAARRRGTYSAAWLAWLDRREWEPLLREHLRSGIVNFESRNRPFSFAWTIEAHPQLRRNLDAFTKGALQLRRLMSTPEEPEKVAEAYSGMQHLWSQRLYVAASGNRLLACARAAGVLDRVGRTMRIDFNGQTIVVSSKPGRPGRVAADRT